MANQGAQKGSSNFKVGLDPRFLAVPKVLSWRFGAGVERVGGDWSSTHSNSLAMSKCKTSISTLAAPDPFKCRTELQDDTRLSVKIIEIDSVTPWLGGLRQVL